MKNDIRTIQIAFNLDDPFQKKLYDHVKNNSSNASLYGKSLIQRDMHGWGSNQNEPELPIELDIDFESFI